MTRKTSNGFSGFLLMIMKKAFVIRLASNNDLQALQEVGARLFDYPIKLERAKEFLEDPRHHLALVFDKNKIVGMASGFHYVHPDKDPILFVNEVAVLDDFQNQGIGRKVVKFLVDQCKNLGCEEAWVATEASNVAARKAYKAAGGLEDEEPVVLIEFKS
ncbi:GNAT family N-acetyltransferase [Allomuricauda sp. SCSIO 65647]|uniref:GNAT family N-acetyltransferase n=1 Tax=Allomuricauda sp. SCSIO 65647 TaxID=2908843 RepID=UPI001F1DA127|nr:GNAT family N-acetyltransferase [Muricauda sp. SCSIO 65647]UJH66184.1 GNAT family N-acetyltransferase [Muricauda sp. SCSIO 65647]